MRYAVVKKLLEGTTLLYGAAILLVAKLWAPELLPLGWIAPAFFIIYEGVFVWLMDRYERMTSQSVVLTSMILRGVKFLAVAAMMFVWVMLALPAKSPLLLYLLGFYLLSSLFEGWSVAAYNREKNPKTE
jgi:hypothetical protein